MEKKETTTKRKKPVDEDKENMLWLEWEIPLLLLRYWSCFGRPTISLSNEMCLWGFQVRDLSKIRGLS